MKKFHCEIEAVWLNMKSHRLLHNGKLTTHPQSGTHVFQQRTQTNKINSVALSPQGNYTDWGTATYQINLVPNFADRGVSGGQTCLYTLSIKFWDWVCKSRLVHPFKELTNIYLIRDMKSVSELNRQTSMTTDPWTTTRGHVWRPPFSAQ
jgi:hypothetical protein